MERLHWLLERAFDEEIGQLSPTFTSVCMRARLPNCTFDLLQSAAWWCKHICI
jgi:hypothetical protein